MSQLSFYHFNFIPEALLVIDPYDDRMVFANHSACALLRLAPPGHLSGQALGETTVSKIFSTCLAELIGFTEAVIHQGRAMSDELTATDSEGISIELEISATRYGDPEHWQQSHRDQRFLVLLLRDKKHFHQWRMVNDSDRAHRHGRLQWQHMHHVFQDIEKQNSLILDAAGDGIYGIDEQGRATFVNPAAERMLGWKAEELIGINIHSVIHHTRPDGSDFCVVDCPIYAAFRVGEVRSVDDDVFWTKSGNPLPVEYTSTPIIDNHRLGGAVVIFRDISERKIAQQKLQSVLLEVEDLKRRLELENAYLQEEISEKYNRHQIIGKSPAVQQTINQIQLVAPTNATVLITGESGTGKELIARAIHNASPRKDRALVRVNCAAIPRDLFESEFFGHKKGAFSGALSERRGRFEVADGGTLFLDEVGEIPIELQGKLLRALQDNEFERVGESTTRRVDVRVIAATNRQLHKHVRDGHFREDLFFRLNVFPIHSAPLRERREDIPLLVSNFLKKACKNVNKSNLSISVGHMQQLQNYHWPGNIRELENVIERQAILSQGNKLAIDINPGITDTTQSNMDISPPTNVVTERECRHYQRQAIVDALQRSQGKIYGKNGAADLLGIKPTTLASRIKKLKITRPC